jgi:hypothetical protein
VHRLFARYLSDHYHSGMEPMVNSNVFSTATGKDHNWNAIALGDTWASASGSWIADTRASYAKAGVTTAFRRLPRCL